MSSLGEIEARLDNRMGKALLVDPQVSSFVAVRKDDVVLLIRAVRQLGGTRTLQGFKVSDLLRVIADDYNKSDVGNMVKQRRAMWLNDLADKMNKTDPDVLDLIAPHQITTVESKG